MFQLLQVRQADQKYRIEWMGSFGNYGRKLVHIRLADGRYAGRVLVQEGLAQPWPNSGNVWCNF